MEYDFHGISVQQAMGKALLMALVDASKEWQQKKSDLTQEFYEAVQRSKVAVVIITAQDVQDKERSLGLIEMFEIQWQLRELLSIAGLRWMIIEI